MKSLNIKSIGAKLGQEFGKIKSFKSLFFEKKTNILKVRKTKCKILVLELQVLWFGVRN